MARPNRTLGSLKTSSIWRAKSFRSSPGQLGFTGKLHVNSSFEAVVSEAIQELIRRGEFLVEIGGILYRAVKERPGAESTSK